MAHPNPGEPGANVRFPPPLVFLAFLLLGIAVDRYVFSGAFTVTRETRIASTAFFLLYGMVLLVLSRLHFKRTGQSLTPWTPTPRLILDGPYSVMRNPMYSGMTVLMLGLGIALNNAWIALGALPALAIVHVIAVLPEERYLTEKFGDSYRRYMARVRRYF